MTWTVVGSVPIGVNWSFSDTVEGEVFRFTLSGSPSTDSYYIAQVSVNDDGNKDLFDICSFTAFGMRQVVCLSKPDYVSKRQIALKQVPQSTPIEAELRRVISNLFLQPSSERFTPIQRATWTTKIEVSTMSLINPVIVPPIQLPSSSNANVTKHNVSIYGNLLTAANPNRIGWSVWNDSSNNLFISCGTGGITQDAQPANGLPYLAKIIPGGTYILDTNYIGPIYSQWDGADGNGAYVTEFVK